MRKESYRVMLLAVLCLTVVVGGMLAPTYIFTASNEFTLSVLIDQVSFNFSNLIGVLIGNSDLGEQRFMGVMVCAVSGAALGMCGSAYQGAFNNPLAAPKTLGVMAGGALGALVYVLFLQNVGPQPPFNASASYSYEQQLGWLASLNPLEWLWVNYGRCLCSVVGCFVVVAFVVFLTTVLGGGKLTNIVVVIFGQIIAAAVTAIIAFARYYFTVDGGTDMVHDLREIENYTMIYSYHFLDMLIIVLPILVCIIIVLAMRRRLTLISFGDDVANTMGVSVNATRYIMIAVCTIMTAWAISFCGHVAYLGFISAHLARRIVGSDFRFLLPASLCTGATLLTIIQWLCQSGLPYTSPYAAGVTCSIVGAAIFIIMVVAQYRKGGNGEWR
ncbi:MAG: iron ABC transporter permease [Coriobacteriia bacterium]|nr:iron ABC transporter permease [Coriobacteriia bacterium]